MEFEDPDALPNQIRCHFLIIFAITFFRHKSISIPEIWNQNKKPCVLLIQFPFICLTCQVDISYRLKVGVLGFIFGPFEAEKSHDLIKLYGIRQCFVLNWNGLSCILVTF